MEITSNTTGKLNKIINGTVFNDKLTCVKEFVQNVQRSKATQCDITLESEYLQFHDNGRGCKNPKNLFTLDLSEWESTSEGFGIGFWSCLCVPKLSRVKVDTYNWEASVSVQNIVEKGDLSVDKHNHPYITNGFCATLYSPYFFENYDEVMDYIKECTKYIDDIDFYVNGVLVEKESLLDTEIDSPYSVRFHNSIFDAKIGVTSAYFGKVVLYYEKRFVAESTRFPYLNGIIEIKSGKVTLREPDRTELIMDDKRKKFYAKLENCAVELYKQFVENVGIDNETMDKAICHWLETKAYEKYVDIDFLYEQKPAKKEKKKVITEGHDVIEENMDSDIETTLESNTSVIDVSDFEKADVLIEQGGPTSVSRPVRTTQHENSVSSVYADYDSRGMNDVKNGVRENLAKMKKAFWVEANMVNDYNDEIAYAKYCNINVIISRTRLHESVLTKYEVPHITELRSCLREHYTFQNIQLKNSKEINFIKLLEPIRKQYNLDDNAFMICDIQKTMELVIKDKVVFKDVQKNKKDSFRIYGCCHGSQVYLDRKALQLTRWNIGEKMGVNELKALMNAVNTIAHELSHALYHTSDNTVEHFNTENRIQETIISLYL